MSEDNLLSRQLAIDIFHRVLREGKNLEDEFSYQIDRQDKKAPLEPRDKMFIRLLVTLMLRRLGQIDDIISHFLQKPLDKKMFYIQDVLRLGTAQIVFLKTPAHASVSTSVNLVKKHKNFSGFSKLTNAVLRRISEKGKAILENQKPQHLNTPSWLFEMWEKEFGYETATKISLSGLKEPPLDFSVKSHPEQWCEKLESFLMPTGTLRRPKQTLIPQLEGFTQGQWWVQDLSASLPAKLFEDLKDKKAIDICAAPGGKTAQMIIRGAKLTAIDISEHRIKTLKENLTRLNLSCEVICQDVSAWWENERNKSERFDAVLLDAPCSATGTFRRHPDVLWHRTKEDITRLQQTQKKLLLTAIDMLKEGGELIFCTCSILPQEGRIIIDEMISSGLVKRRPLLSTELPFEMITKDGDLCVLPFFYEQEGGCDGFFASRLIKNKEL